MIYNFAKYNISQNKKRMAEPVKYGRGQNPNSAANRFKPKPVKKEVELPPIKKSAKKTGSVAEAIEGKAKSAKVNIPRDQLTKKIIMEYDKKLEAQAKRIDEIHELVKKLDN